VRCCSIGSAGTQRDRAPSHPAGQPDHDGKIERFHQTLRRDPLADHEPVDTVGDLQAALDA
jgi:hypothetical protein